MKNAKKRGMAPRYDPWAHYVQPLLDYVPKYREEYPDIAFRVHLAKDLDFLIDDLVAAGCEVYHMKHSSLAFAPGGLWRFLPIAEEGKIVTVVDIDRIGELPTDLERTKHLVQSDLGAWKVPVWNDFNPEGEVCYLPFAGCQSGWKGGCVEIVKLLKTFTWLSMRKEMPISALLPFCEEKPVTKTTWPDYGFDEWFLAAAVYPRAAQNGIVNFIPNIARSVLLTMDVEYTTWSNTNSEMIYFPVAQCC